jgi:DNA polymerase (family 10)
VGKSRSEREQIVSGLTNSDIAAQLDEVAEHLENQNANPFRIQAYRNAASTLRKLTRPANRFTMIRAFVD